MDGFLYVSVLLFAGVIAGIVSRGRAVRPGALLVLLALAAGAAYLYG